MRIDYIEMENWRCFLEHTRLDFDQIEIFCLRNGSGKSSVFLAILYALYGKVQGTLASYQNHNGQTKIKIGFFHDGDEYEIEREFPHNKAILKQNGQEIRNGIREVYEFMDNLVDYNIIKRLWFNGDVSNSEILEFGFFQNNILSEILREPNKIADSLNKDLNSYKKQLRNITIDETRDPKEIESDINELTGRLKERSSISDVKYNNALLAKQNQEKFNEFKKDFTSPLIEKDIISKWNKINLYNTQIQLKEEKEKNIDEVLSSISQSFLNQAIKENDLRGKCVICNGEWKQTRSDYIKDLLSKGFQDNNEIKRLEELIEFKRKYNEEEITKSERYYELESRLPNYDYQEILDSYNKENDLMWEKLDKLNSEYKNSIYNQSKIDESNELTQKINETSKKLEVVRNYLKKATKAHIDNTFGKASEYLKFLNPRYTNIYIDDEAKDIMIEVDSQPLFVTQLSGGEKTMVALALVIAIRDQYTPGMPLIFDESFAALDSENNDSVINLLKNSPDQLFVITHNIGWIEYPDYGANTKIRKSW